MTNQVLIWDLDGTIIDSYDGIMQGVKAVTTAINADYTDDEIYHYIKAKSVYEFFDEIKGERPFDDLMSIYKAATTHIDDFVKPMPHAHELFEALQQAGIKNFIYTHKSDSANHVLKKLKLDHYFDEVVTSNYKFVRKPSGEALEYLIDKYHLDRAQTFYVGDRKLDIDCGVNAGVKTIFLNADSPVEVDADYVIHDLLEIKAIIM